MCSIIQIDWIRHGLSCANVMHHHGFGGGGRQVFIRDPDLTNLGFEEAKQAGKCLNVRREAYDMVCASVMSRAIETAIGIFEGSGQTIHVIPFVSEMRRFAGLDKQNAPKETLKELQDHIRNFQRAKGSTARIDYSGVTDTTIWDEGKKEPSVEKFKTHVLPELVKVIWKSRGRAFEGKPFQLKETTSGRKVRVDGKKVFRIAIVSHGRYIREATGLETFLEEMKTKNKLSKFFSAKVCQPFPQLEDCCTTKDPAIEAVARGKSYSNPNTSIWRAVLIGSGCKNRFVLGGERLEKIYTPANSKEHGGLTPDDISNCPKAVRDTITPFPNYKAGYIEGMPFSG